MGLERFLLNCTLLCMRSVHKHGKPKSVCLLTLAWDRWGLVEADLCTHVQKSCQGEEIVGRFDIQQPTYLSVVCVAKKLGGYVKV